MLNRRIPAQSFAIALAAAIAWAQSGSREESLVNRISRVTEAEQMTLAKSALDMGVPNGDLGASLYSLVQGRSSLILPVIERKIEECLSAPKVLDCFADKTVDPERALFRMADAITHAGNDEALVESSMLIKLDAKRFDFMVRNTMFAAFGHRNPFVLAYQGYALGDPAVDKRITQWADEVLAKEVPHAGNPIYDGVTTSPRRQWAEALVDRYGGVSTPDQWQSDPIVSRVKGSTAGLLFNDVHRFAVEVAQKHSNK